MSVRHDILIPLYDDVLLYARKTGYLFKKGKSANSCSRFFLLTFILLTLTQKSHAFLFT